MASARAANEARVGWLEKVGKLRSRGGEEEPLWVLWDLVDLCEDLGFYTEMGNH